MTPTQIFKKKKTKPKLQLYHHDPSTTSSNFTLFLLIGASTLLSPFSSYINPYEGTREGKDTE